MLPTQLTRLPGADDPALASAIEVVDGFDHTLVHGLARVGGPAADALARLGGALDGTPLGDRVAEAVEKSLAGSIADEHLAALAGARTALLGAVHDQLLDGADTALGRSRPAWTVPPVPAADTQVNLLTGVRAWLRELAVAGWRGTDHDTLSAATALLPALLAEPALRRLAVLLDGLAAELQASSPVATMDTVPARRWADLWARAVLLAQPGTGHSGTAVAGVEPAEVSGRLLPLGVDVHEHGTAVQFQVHAVLEPAGTAPPQLVRTSIAVAKVDTITGPTIWSLSRTCPVLLAALTERRALQLTGMPLLPTGDLLWQDDRAHPGDPTDPFATARVLLGAAATAAVPPLDRHPVRIAEPVLVERYTVTATGDTITFDLDGARLPVAVDRLAASTPLTRELVTASSACLGLLRWDTGGWALQPLAVQATVKRRTVAVHSTDWALGPTDAKAAKAAAATGDAVAVLRERAGRLLRK